MAITFGCPDCQQMISVPDSFAGKRGKCPGCNLVVTIPAGAAPPPPTPGPAQAAGAGAAGAGAAAAPEAGAPEMKDCPYCGEEIKAKAKKCRYCGEFLSAAERRARAPVRRRYEAPVENKADKDLDAVDWVLCFLCPGIACIVGFVALLQGYTKRGGIMIALGVGMGFVYNVILAAAG